MDDRFVNLGEEVILTLLWKSGTSESATVSFVIILNICYWLLCLCVCERDSERERERERQWERERDRVTSQHILIAVCVCERERERERERDRVTSQHILIAVCVCVWERERERGSHHSGVYNASEIVLSRLVCKHIRASSLCLSHDSVPL